jgi:predicted amidohydrolase YtcJ
MTAAAATLFPARRVVTMEPNSPTDSPEATAVMVSGDRIIAVGSYADLRDVGNAPCWARTPTPSNPYS